MSDSPPEPGPSFSENARPRPVGPEPGGPPRDQRLGPGGSSWTPSAGQAVTAILLLVFLVGFPWLNPGYRFLSLGITTGITTIALYGLGLQFGQAGIMSVGHAAFIGIGAYTAAILAGNLGMGFWLALPFSALFSALAAGLIGLPSLRVSGQHYIIITFCFCALFNITITSGGSFPAGASGLDVGLIAKIFGINFDQLRNAYSLVIAILVLCLLVPYLIVNSSYGRTLRAIRENELLARAVGINANRHKIGVLMVSGAFAGVAGILQAYYLR